MTTAEKIKVMQAFEDGLTIQIEGDRGWEDWLDCQPPEWHWGSCNYRIKPPDPEPLECWVNVLEGNALAVYRTQEQATKPAYGGPTRKRAGVHMREVTPQMLQDEINAARWQEVKEARMHASPLWNRLLEAPTDEWNRLIDEAME